MSKDYRKYHRRRVGAIFGVPPRSLLRTLREEAKERKSEETVYQALHLMVDRGEAMGFWKATRQEDKKGIDFTVRVLDKDMIPTEVRLQIKSSVRGARIHQKKAAENGSSPGTNSYIHIVIIKPGDGVEEVIPKIERIIKRHVS